jgi:hypothetical protein
MVKDVDVSKVRERWTSCWKGYLPLRSPLKVVVYSSCHRRCLGKACRKRKEMSMRDYLTSDTRSILRGTCQLDHIEEEGQSNQQTRGYNQPQESLAHHVQRITQLQTTDQQSEDAKRSPIDPPFRGYDQCLELSHNQTERCRRFKRHTSTTNVAKDLASRLALLTPTKSI